MRRLSAAELRPGSAATLFVFAGAGGDTKELAPLADALTGDVKVVALAAVTTPGTDTVEAMAVEAVALIRSTQQQGPYRLLGYSFGGLLALESADLLRSAGESVEFVGLVDALFDQRYWPTSLFLKASVRRAIRHARAMLHRTPVEAGRELARRSARMARRLRARYAAAEEGSAAPATIQEANLAVLARWHPRRFDFDVTLFAAEQSDFGCELADLWRPWLPRLEAQTVPGNHLDLMQTAAGVVRLANSLSRALEESGPRLTVLVATTFRWPGAARLAVDLHQVGWTVEAIAPRGSALHTVAAVRRSHRLGLADPIRSLGRAIESSGADLVVPFDDRTRDALGMLRARTESTTTSGVRLREALERSLGSPCDHTSVYSRAALAEIATAAGVSCPPTTVVRSKSEVAAWFGQGHRSAVLKTDGSWGGRGVAIVHSEADARRAWRELSRRPPFVRALKRLIVERDPWALRARLVGTPPTVSIQPYVEGRAANAAIACFGGTSLGTVQAEVVESDGRTGPSTVVRLIENADISYAAKSVVNSLDLSGLCGLDFIIDDHGRAHLLELNPRATPTSHLIGAGGADLLTALRTACGQEDPPPRTSPYGDGPIALFPQELRRDPGSPNFEIAYHDIPTYAPDLVVAVSSTLRAARRRSVLSGYRRGQETTCSWAGPEHRHSG